MSGDKQSDVTLKFEYLGLGDRGVQGKYELILDRSTFHDGSNAANRVAKKFEVWSVEVDAFFTFIRKFGVQTDLFLCFFLGHNFNNNRSLRLKTA